MATFPSTTRSVSDGSGDRAFFADAEAFDSVLDVLHAAIDAEALVGPNPFDPAVSDLAGAASDAWSACEDGASRFLSRPGLHADHVMAAEHVLDVLRSEVTAFVVPAAIQRAALRHGRQRNIRSVVLSRQLSHAGSALLLIIDDARRAEDVDSAIGDEEDLPPAA
ncbi:hypothetical protein PARPLA_03268 [Rhodobacteraceae bacterium THAF1]|uniref:hypothetical protein n=1 Tax=Palleronia sp. THAF1 TaxID=2587842 RepID=UPI000F3F7130|nr:hypothetical protein [Palleronia sp. THAF1]QFU08758.1 hypothetical protein FIU81_08745 [Palleronia sp. THAF1]VDC31255.1 hypothetical protein PARPLA_03268 [Rhodobacteraceae bacterium THAF1]